MTDNQTAAWIFLATALASETSHADLNSISSIADGINHAVPTPEELQNSMTWLTNNGLVIQQGNKYSLTEKGKLDYKDSSKKTSKLFKIWDNLETTLKKYRT